MLSKEELKNYYSHFRNFTVRQSGIEIANLEKMINKVFSSHQEALEEIEKFKKSREIKIFKLYWLNGRVEEVKGTTIQHACSKAGLGVGAIRALDYFEEV